MLNFRPFSILAPRIFQLLGWTYDPTPHVQPLLSVDDTLATKQKATEAFGKTALLVQSKLPMTYQPPAYKPPTATFQN
jgi:hypothetical protein